MKKEEHSRQRHSSHTNSKAFTATRDEDKLTNHNSPSRSPACTPTNCYNAKCASHNQRTVNTKRTHSRHAVNKLQRSRKQRAHNRYSRHSRYAQVTTELEHCLPMATSRYTLSVISACGSDRVIGCSSRDSKRPDTQSVQARDTQSVR